ncbi:hypothetical protein ACFQ3N_16755 [Virgibacillus byunsanensis]|uniref:Uncharacterized protein n=1 Tax=Virgibacillus byunsanensis TaxID=570945 RepID=A0ABW3LR90_9BACI
MEDWCERLVIESTTQERLNLYGDISMQVFMEDELAYPNTEGLTRGIMKRRIDLKLNQLIVVNIFQ